MGCARTNCLNEKSYDDNGEEIFYWVRAPMEGACLEGEPPGISIQICNRCFMHILKSTEIFIPNLIC